MAPKTFKLSAMISSDNPGEIEPVLRGIIGDKGTVRRVDDGFHVEASLSGESARDLNRMLLSEMRKAERRTRLRAEWTSDVVERFFDYVPKGTREIS
ncbi:MAG: hypothetical protein HY688_01595 [Chloroflexi bacterium]|nr:hypothetical protein [Chloroflexota bacterium]